MPDHLILCEGPGDECVIKALLEHLAITDIDVENYRGCDNLRHFLPAFAKRPEVTQKKIRHLLVTRDNDINPDSAWQSLSGTVKRSFGVTLTQPGQVVESDKGLKISEFTIPAPDVSGMIETLCIDSLRSDDGAISCLNVFVQCLENCGQKVHSKARFNAWVATQPNFKDLKNLQGAVRGAHFNFDAASFQPLIDCLTAFAGDS